MTAELTAGGATPLSIIILFALHLKVSDKLNTVLVHDSPFIVLCITVHLPGLFDSCSTHAYTYTTKGMSNCLSLSQHLTQLKPLILLQMTEN